MTGKCCSMSPFSKSYNLIQDVQISTCLTAYTGDYGRNWILVFDAVIWLGTIMYHSLISPNQIKITVIPFSDDMFDDNLKLGITHKKVFIPFNTDGAKVYFYSRVPTQHEIMECTHIIITVETK